MLASFFLDRCLKAGIRFFSGVPDSFLKGLCDELYTRYGTSSSHHIVAHNEGGAVSLCAGHYLGTGHPALCYMQNSGLGNAVNPITSLMDQKVYGIPCLLVIGWRGEPGTKDEPQHIQQGAITLSQLDLLNIPYRILSSDTSDDNFLNDFDVLYNHLSTGRMAAFVIRKGVFQSCVHPDYSNAYHMSREKAAEIILSSLSVSDEFFEACTLFGVKPCDAFVTIDIRQLPIRVRHDERVEMLHLRLVGFLLWQRTDTAVCSHLYAFFLVSCKLFFCWYYLDHRFHFFSFLKYSRMIFFSAPRHSHYAIASI